MHIIIQNNKYLLYRKGGIDMATVPTQIRIDENLKKAVKNILDEETSEE